MKKIILLLCLLPLLSTTSCNNDDDNNTQNPIDQLPPETQSGANTFGFLVNGEPISVTNTSQQTAIYQQGQLQFGGGIDNSERDIGISISLVDPITINIDYDLTNFPMYTAQFGWREGEINCSYPFEDTYQGTVRFSNIDTTNFIISGTFEFSTITDGCENISITNGRFDLQYIP